MRLIGLGGYAGAGKDAFAEALAPHGYVRLGMSDPMLEMALAINPIIDIHPETCDFLRLAEYHEHCGLDWAVTKLHPEVREFLQRLGTEGGRGVLGENVWVNAMLDRAYKLLAVGKRVAVTGIRFENERKAIYENGGLLVLIQRPGYGPINNHASEVLAGEVDKWDVVIDNDGTLRDLARKAEELVSAERKAA